MGCKKVARVGATGLHLASQSSQSRPVCGQATLILPINTTFLALLLPTTIQPLTIWSRCVVAGPFQALTTTTKIPLTYTVTCGMVSDMSWRW